MSKADIQKQYVDHWTVGWNSNGQLVPIPVLAKWRQLQVVDYKQSRYVVESPYEAAINRQCTIYLASDARLFELDVDGNREKLDKNYKFRNYSVWAYSPMAATMAVADIALFESGTIIDAKAKVQMVHEAKGSAIPDDTIKNGDASKLPSHYRKTEGLADPSSLELYKFKPKERPLLPAPTVQTVKINGKDREIIEDEPNIPQWATKEYQSRMRHDQ